jgi:hypothetical protein
MRLNVKECCSSLEGKEHDRETKQFRFRPAKLERVPALVGFPSRLGIVPHLSKTRCGIFYALNRVATAIGVRPTAGEGMARVERQPSPLNRCLRVALFAKSDRCNIGPREQASVGNGNHCARMFQMRSDNRRCDGRQRKPLSETLMGVVCARSYTPARYSPIAPSRLKA